MFIDLGSNVNDQDDQGRTVLNWTIILVGVRVAEEDDAITDDAMKLELINYLIEKGADVTLTDADGNDALKLAIISDQSELIITRFIDSIKSGDENGNPSLVSPSKSDEAEKPVKPKLSRRTIQVINQKNKAGFTPLQLMLLAKLNGNNALLRILLDVGADPNIADDEDENNALHSLFHSDLFDNSKYVREVNKRYNVHIGSVVSLNTPFSAKAYFDILIEHGVDIDAVNKNGKSSFELVLTSPVPLNLYILSKLIPTKRETVEAINAGDNGSLSILKLLLKKDRRYFSCHEFETFVDKLIGVGCNINEPGLLCDAIHNFNFKYEMITILVDKKIPITVQDIKESVQQRRLDVALLLLNTFADDPEKVEEVRTTYPEILLQSFGPFERQTFVYDLRCNSLELVTVLLGKYKIDVNYSFEGCFVLHNLVQENKKDAIKILEYLIENYPRLDINRKVSMKTIKLTSALELVLLKNDRFEFASILIRNFVYVEGLCPPVPSANGFTECYQLLYQLKVPMNSEPPLDSPATKKEIDWFNEWMDRDKSNVKPLSKLVSLVIRRCAKSRSEIEHITNRFLLPDTVEKMLYLKDPQEVYIPDQ